MRIFGLLALVFLLAAFSIGISLEDKDRDIVDSAMNNASQVISNITLNPSIPEDSKIPNMEGLFNVLENYIRFVGTFAIEVFRAGVYFGQDNPDYFEAGNIIRIMQWIIWLIIIGLLIKPVGYIVIFLVLVVMKINDIVKVKKKKKYDQSKKEVKTKWQR